MKKTIFITAIIVFNYNSIFSQKYNWRVNKNHEISVHANAMWGEFYAYGIGYERNILKLNDGKHNQFLSWHTNVFMRIVHQEQIDFSSKYNQLQTFIRYNVGYKNILSAGLGTILVGEKFFINPTLIASYKHDYRKKRITLAFNYQISRYFRNPPNRFPPPAVFSASGPQKTSIFENWCTGISVGKYF
jgi:hypothetical protein